MLWCGVQCLKWWNKSLTLIILPLIVWMSGCITLRLELICNNQATLTHLQESQRSDTVTRFVDGFGTQFPWCLCFLSVFCLYDLCPQETKHIQLLFLSVSGCTGRTDTAPIKQHPCFCFYKSSWDCKLIEIISLKGNFRQTLTWCSFRSLVELQMHTSNLWHKSRCCTTLVTWVQWNQVAKTALTYLRPFSHDLVSAVEFQSVWKFLHSS